MAGSSSSSGGSFLFTILLLGALCFYFSFTSIRKAIDESNRSLSGIRRAVERDNALVQDYVKRTEAVEMTIKELLEKSGLEIQPFRDTTEKFPGMAGAVGPPGPRGDPTPGPRGNTNPDCFELDYGLPGRPGPPAPNKDLDDALLHITDNLAATMEDLGTTIKELQENLGLDTRSFRDEAIHECEENKNE